MTTITRRLAALLACLLGLPALAASSPKRTDLAALDPVAQAVVSEALGAKDPAYRMGMEGRFIRARNKRQSLTAALGSGGMAISVANSEWRMRLASWGRAEALREATAVETRVKGNRVEVERDGLTEWWVNGPVGLQQGWTVAERPAGRGPLMLALAQSGALRGAVAEDNALEVRDAAGATVLRYGGLTAIDARGRKLPVRFEALADEVRIHVEDAAAAYPLLIDPIAQQAYVKSSHTGAGDRFGYSVAISGDTLVVGAVGEDSNATGVNGNDADNSASQSGAAYVFVRSGSNWSQQAYLKASNTNGGDQFGASVAISGETIVVGAIGEDSNATGVNGNEADNSSPESGAAYVFVRSGSAWTQQAYLKASNTGAGDQFGRSLAILGDTLVVGAPDEDSNAIGVNGTEADNSATNSGAAYLFVRSGSTWGQQAYLKASNTGNDDRFGISVAISGDTIVVGAYFESSNATGMNGNQADNSSLASGAAYVFVSNAGTWGQQAYLKASNTGAFDQFGASVAISGDTLVVGAYSDDSNATGVNGDQTNNSVFSAGAAYVFVRVGSTWSQQAYLKASNIGADDWFGYSVAISGDTIVVGAWGEDSNATGVNGGQNYSAGASGAAYVFVRIGSSWSQRAYLKASNTGIDDMFGHSVAMSGRTIVVGAILEDSNATGLNGNQADNSATDAGAAYVFLATAPTVASIVPAGPTPTTAASVDFTVTFDVAVTGVDVTDFGLTATGIAGASVTGIAGSGTTYTVTVNTGSGSGTLRLDVVDDDTIVNILPLGGTGAGNGSFTTGTPYTLDRTGPAVTSVAVPSAANYVTGQNLGFTVNWNEAVNVVGTPQLALTIGATTRQASYVSGAGSTALLFRYTVIAADNDQDGVSVGVLVPNGGTIRDALANDATLALNGVGVTTTVFVNRTFAVTASISGGNGTITPSPQTIAQGANATFTVTPSVGYTASVGGTCAPGSLVGTTYTTGAITADCTVVATFTSGAVTTFTGPTATGTGNATVTITGGGPTCGFAPQGNGPLQSAFFIALEGHVKSPPAGTSPQGFAFPHGLLDFVLINCTPGSTVGFTVTYPSAIPVTSAYWKYGPRPGAPTPSWYTIPATIAGNTMTFSITDAGLGDDDLAANGTIVDQGGPGAPQPGVGAVQTPTLSQWMLIVLAILMALSAPWAAGLRQHAARRLT